MAEKNVDEVLDEYMGQFYWDALGWVIFCFPWDEDVTLQVVDWEAEDLFVDPKTGFIYDDEPKGLTTITYKEWMAPYRARYNTRFGPDRWACEWLDEVSKGVVERDFSRRKAVSPQRLCTASGHGIGKSTLVAWVILWIMSTRPGSRGTVTANTAEQLRNKTWAELGKWHKRCITGHWFKYNSGRGNMSLRRIDNEEEWYCSGQTCREENSESFAGQHAATATSFYIFDEASAVPDSIYVVREGGTVTGEPMVFDFGNPTRNSGRFYEQCEGKLRHRHSVRKIDSRTVAITNKARIREWVEDFGEDSDFVKVRVRGEFPSAGSLQFIPTAWVQRAAMRELGKRDRFAAVTIGVDVARFGDDSSVIYPVVGNDARSFAPRIGDGIYQGLDNVQVAEKVKDKIEFFKGLGVTVSAVFIDVTGVWAGVVDILTHDGYDVEGISFGGSPVEEPERYRFRVDEMWGKLKDRIKTDLVMPELAELMDINDERYQESVRNVGTRLFAELTQREFGYTIAGEKINLESKRDMKARGVPSPDIADALALNYARKVARVAVPHGNQGKQQMTDHEFNPLDNVSVG